MGRKFRQHREVWVQREPLPLPPPLTPAPLCSEEVILDLPGEVKWEFPRRGEQGGSRQGPGIGEVLLG